MSMSASDSEEDVLLSTRRAPRPALFHSSDSDTEPESAPAPPQPRRAARQHKAAAHLADARAPRAAPRFLGDGDAADDLFGDLSSVPNSRPAARPARLDPRALDALPAASPDPAPRASTSAARAVEDGLDIDSVWQNADENGVDGVVAKKKRVVAKMDDVRLLGPAGFPRLMHDIKRARFKGKGHERGDLKRLLSMYQLWAHQMYPKFNLKDSLAAVEKLCHKRTVQIELRQYRQEAKDAARPQPPELGGVLPDNAPPPTTAAAAAAAELEAIDTDDMFGFDEDEEAMLAELEGGAPAASRPKAPRPPPAPAPARAALPEDDLDAMEEEVLRAAQEEFNMDEDEEAMLREMDEMM